MKQEKTINIVTKESVDSLIKGFGKFPDMVLLRDNKFYSFQDVIENCDAECTAYLNEAMADLNRFRIIYKNAPGINTWVRKAKLSKVSFPIKYFITIND